MRTFGQRHGGGRRSAPRISTPAPAVVRTLCNTSYAEVIDISCTGVRLRCSALPDIGEEVDLRIDALSAFGTVVWATADECGIDFDVPLPEFHVSGLKWRTGLAGSGKLTVDEQLALEQWACGVSR
jgi:hypothetical protein